MMTSSERNALESGYYRLLYVRLTATMYLKQPWPQTAVILVLWTLQKNWKSLKCHLMRAFLNTRMEVLFNWIQLAGCVMTWISEQEQKVFSRPSNAMFLLYWEKLTNNPNASWRLWKYICCWYLGWVTTS